MAITIIIIINYFMIEEDHKKFPSINIIQLSFYKREY